MTFLRIPIISVEHLGWVTPQNGPTHQTIRRQNRPEVFYENGVPENIAAFIGKHLCQSLFFDKVA